LGTWLDGGASQKQHGVELPVSFENHHNRFAGRGLLTPSGNDLFLCFSVCRGRTGALKCIQGNRAIGRSM
jgi:hypothetical protein